LVDSHVHLLSRQYNRDRNQVIQRAFDAGNEFLVEVATDAITSEQAAKMPLSFHGIYAAVGVHPHDARTADDRVLHRLEQLADAPGVVAIGEIGLDFYRDLSPRDVQKKVFTHQIALARRKKLPVILHVRQAYREALDILEAEQPFESGGVLHCFSGDAASAQRALKMGFMLGFGGTITYERSDGRRHVDATPLERILLETDAPYLAPEPHRSKRNEPAYVRLVLDAVAAIKNVPREKVDEATTSNARKLFRVDEVEKRVRSAARKQG
jgi:TatD DNase family protein